MLRWKSFNARCQTPKWCLWSHKGMSRQYCQEIFNVFAKKIYLILFPCTCERYNTPSVMVYFPFLLRKKFFFFSLAVEPWSPVRDLSHLWISLPLSVAQDKNTTVTGGDLSPVIMIFRDISHPCQFSINYQQSKTCWLIKTNCLGSEGQVNLFIIW